MFTVIHKYSLQSQARDKLVNIDFTPLLKFCSCMYALTTYCTKGLFLVKRQNKTYLFFIFKNF